MAETTTIEVTKEQKQTMDELKLYPSESYKSVLARLLENVEVEA